ncbi:MAG: monovalent cation/H(+) antiporter subunit G [Acidimicrobiales bacterium]
MNATSLVSDVLLVAGLAVVVASCAGVALIDEPMAKVHLVAPAALLGTTGICAAIVVRSGLSSEGLAAILVAVIIAGTSPFTSHAIARCILVRRRAEHPGGEPTVGSDGPSAEAGGGQA